MMSFVNGNGADGDKNATIIGDSENRKEYLNLRLHYTPFWVKKTKRN